MRLTLRTLLAWLDGVLVPEEQRSFGARVAGSTVATGLSQRILNAVGRADVDAPRVESWGTPDDANFVADYLDNRLDAGRIEWFERLCIQSELRLAEVADCHGAVSDLSRLGNDQDVATSTTASTRDRLKQLVHRAMADRCGGSAATMPRLTIESAPGRGVGGNHPAGRSDPPVTPRATAESPPPRGTLPARRPPEEQGQASGHDLAPASSRASTSQRKILHAKARRGPSDRLSAAIAVALLLLIGGGAVAWLNFGGQGTDPRRAAVDGFVTFDGAPLENGVVVLLPTGDTKGPTAGSSVSRGQFSIAAAAGPVLGRYRVEVKAMRRTGRQVKSVAPIAGRKEREQSEQFIPARYNTASEIEVQIKPGRNTIKLDLLPPPTPQPKPGAAAKPPRIVVGSDRFPVGSGVVGRPG